MSIYLGYENKDEVEFEIKAFNKKEVAIKLFKLPKKFDWHIGLLKDKRYISRTFKRWCLFFTFRKFNFLYYCWRKWEVENQTF